MSNIYKLTSKGVTYDLSNTIISDTEPTGENRLPIWIQPDYKIRAAYYSDYIDEKQYYWQFNNGNLEEEETDNLSNIVLGGVINGVNATSELIMESALIPAVGKQYEISFAVNSWGEPITIPSTAPIGLVYYDSNNEYIGDSINEIGATYETGDTVYYVFDTIPSNATKFLVILPPQVSNCYITEIFLMPTSGSTQFSYNILQSNGKYYPIFKS